MADVIVESVSCELWQSKLNLLESQYENTKLLVNQDTLACQKWKRELDLLLNEEKLYEQSRNVCRLKLTVEEANREIKTTKEKGVEDKKATEERLKTQFEEKMVGLKESYKEEKDALEKEIRHLKETNEKIQLQAEEVEKRLLSEGYQKLKKQEEKYEKMKDELSEDVRTWKEKNEKAEKVMEELKAENNKNVLAKESIEEEIKMIRRSLKTETDEKLIKQVEKSTEEKCQLTHELKEWKEKHANALTEIENLKAQLSSKNVTMKVKSTQTQVIKTQCKGVLVCSQTCESGTQIEKEFLQIESTKESDMSLYEVDEETEKRPTERQALMAKREQKEKNIDKVVKKGKSTNPPKQNEGMNDQLPDPPRQCEDEREESQLDEYQNIEKSLESKALAPNDLTRNKLESTTADHKQGKQVEKPLNEKGKRQRKNKKTKGEEGKISNGNKGNDVMNEPPSPCDVTEPTSDKIKPSNEGENPRKRGKKTSKAEKIPEEVPVNDVIMEEDTEQQSNHEDNSETLKTVRKRKEHPRSDDISSDSSAAKKSKTSLSDNGKKQNSLQSENISPQNSERSDAKKQSKSTNSDETVTNSVNCTGKDVENQRNQSDASLKEKNVPRNKSILTKPPLYRPSMSIRQSTASDIPSVLNQTKPPVYRPSMSIRQSSVSDMSSVLNGTKRRTLYNSKADNSLMISMLPLQESFMNSTTSRGKKSNGAMPASLSAFLKSFTAPKLKKNTTA